MIIHFFTTPIFYLTPYIVLWSMLNGLLTIALLKWLNIKTSRITKLVTASITAIASIIWNWSIEFNQSTIYLNVDHTYLRISWADTLNGVCVFGLNALILGLWVNPQSQASTVAKIAGVAALLTILTDTFFF
jgi:hypothetical protein